ncbi:MAG: hypothetical protein V7677_19115, partial [Motiliproteus sp.]
RDLHPEERRETLHTLFFPLYEWRPFLFLAAGAVFPAVWGDVAVFFSGALLCATGILLLIVRAQSRTRAWHEKLIATTHPKLNENPYAAIKKSCQGSLCHNHKLCQSVPLPKSKISECMRLLQHLDPEHVQHHIDDHSLSNHELMATLKSLHLKADDCATWSKNISFKTS